MVPCLALLVLFDREVSLCELKDLASACCIGQRPLILDHCQSCHMSWMICSIGIQGALRAEQHCHYEG